AAVQAGGCARQGGSDRVLPHRRALEPYLVRAQVPARPQESAQLRRLVDRVGKPGGRADRKGDGVSTATEGRKDGRTEGRVFAEPPLWRLVGNTPLLPLPSFRPAA